MLNAHLLTIVILAPTVVACTIDPFPARTSQDAATNTGGSGGAGGSGNGGTRGSGGAAGQTGGGPSGGSSAAGGATGGTLSADSNFVLSTVGDGQSPAIAVDKSGNAHVTYYNYYYNMIRYATNKSGAWVVTDIGTFNLALPHDNAYNAAKPSIAVDTNGNVHISYYQIVSTGTPVAQLQYVTNQSGSWVTAEVASSYYLGLGTNSSLAVGSSGGVYIAYPWTDCRLTAREGTSCNQGVHLITNASGSWSWYQVYNNIYSVGFNYDFTAFDVNLSVALDSNAHAHVASAQYNNSILRYSTNASGAWNTTVVEQTTRYGGHYPSLAISSGSIPVVAYYGDNGVKIATNSTGTWTPFIVTKGSFANSTDCMPRIAIDTSDKIYVICPGRVDVYGSGFSGTLVGSLGSTQLSGMTVGTSALGVTTVLALDTKNKVHIAYQSSGGQIMYVTNK